MGRPIWYHLPNVPRSTCVRVESMLFKRAVNVKRGFQIWFKRAVNVISEDAPRTSGSDTSYVRHIKLKHQKGKKADLARNMRRMKKEGYRSHPLRIKYKTMTPLAALMRKWPWIVVAQLRLQGKAYWYASDRTGVLGVQSQPFKCNIQMICG